MLQIDECDIHRLVFEHHINFNEVLVRDTVKESWVGLEVCMFD